MRIIPETVKWEWCTRSKWLVCQTEVVTARWRKPSSDTELSFPKRYNTTSALLGVRCTHEAIFGTLLSTKSCHLRTPTTTCVPVKMLSFHFFILLFKQGKCHWWGPVALETFDETIGNAQNVFITPDINHCCKQYFLGLSSVLPQYHFCMQSSNTFCSLRKPLFTRERIWILAVAGGHQVFKGILTG